MSVVFDVGLDIIRSYKRLNYTAWHALAEFVDNSTQSYFDHKAELDPVLETAGEPFRVDITYERNDDILRIGDNAMGMELDELDRALKVGAPPPNDRGRSEFGMGMKTAACWFGDYWSVTTKKLGSTTEYKVTVDVEAVAAGDSDLPIEELEVTNPDLHYTYLEIRRLHSKLQTRTINKIKDHLRSMYRQDIREGLLRLYWQHNPLEWEESDDRFLKSASGKRFKKDFEFEVDGKKVWGWVGVLGPGHGGRSRAGLSVLRHGRVVHGHPEPWRPEKLFGEDAPNNLVNQRLTGEVHLDDFAVSHTKDAIVWKDEQYEDVVVKLAEVGADYRERAAIPHKQDPDIGGPTEVQIQAAAAELQDELQSVELEDLMSTENVPTPEMVASAIGPLVESVEEAEEPAFTASISVVDLGDFDVKLYLQADLSPNDPYVAVESTSDDEVLVIVNLRHPHFRQLGGDSLTMYLRHCVYDAVAEWWARRRTGLLEPNTIKLLKDKLLRLSFEIASHRIAAVS